MGRFERKIRKRLSEDAADLEWMRSGKAFTRDDPDGEWFYRQLELRAGPEGILVCLHCGSRAAVVAIREARAEYCICGAAWFLDGESSCLPAGDVKVPERKGDE